MRDISRSILLLATGFGLACAAAPAQARTCPSGQFLQVSKGKCISKDSARKLGIAGHAAHAADRAKPGKAEAKAEKAGQTTVARSAPEPATEGAAADAKGAAQAETTLASAAPAVGASLGYAAPPAETFTVRRSIAPFGALQFGGLR